jgi:hypothetical protein
VEDIIQLPLNKDVFRNIMFDEPKSFLAEEVGNIMRITSNEIVHANDVMSLLYEPVTQVAS